jgi:hypothetical protein
MVLPEPHDVCRGERGQQAVLQRTLAEQGRALCRPCVSAAPEARSFAVFANGQFLLLAAKPISEVPELAAARCEPQLQPATVRQLHQPLARLRALDCRVREFSARHAHPQNIGHRTEDTHFSRENPQTVNKSRLPKVVRCGGSFDFLDFEQFRGDRDGDDGFEEDRP